MKVPKGKYLVVAMAVIPNGVWNLENITLCDGNGNRICPATIYNSPEEVKEQLDTIVKYSKIKWIPFTKSKTK